MKKVIWFIIIGIALFAAGHTVGRNSVKLPEPLKSVEYKFVKGDTIRDTIQLPTPFAVRDTIRDTVKIERFLATDTAALFAIWCDYYLIRDYNFNFGNDTAGVFNVRFNVTKNKAYNVISNIQPVQKIVIEREAFVVQPKFRMWAMAGYSPQTFKISAGFDYKRLKIGVSGIRLGDKNGYTIDIGVNN
jgi:hypothetical protein